MSIETDAFDLDYFEIDSAKKEPIKLIVETFVETPVFRRLFTTKNQIILGARGSGKTALAKMLSHDHLSQFDSPVARAIISSKQFIGTYVPTKIEWVGGLKNKPKQTEEEKEEFFQWRLNIATCIAFLSTLESCLVTYIENKGRRAVTESNLVNQISKDWTENKVVCSTIPELKKYLESIEYQRQQQLARQRAIGGLRQGEEPVGVCFNLSLFTPLKQAITHTALALDFPPEYCWMICLDEAEFLDKELQRIINTHLR